MWMSKPSLLKLSTSPLNPSPPPSFPVSAPCSSCSGQEPCVHLWCLFLSCPTPNLSGNPVGPTSKTFPEPDCFSPPCCSHPGTSDFPLRLVWSQHSSRNNPFTTLSCMSPLCSKPCKVSHFSPEIQVNVPLGVCKALQNLTSGAFSNITPF